MFDFSELPVFLIAVFVILVTPGPDMVFMVASGLAGGRKGAIQAAFGITLGVSVYVMLTALGLATLFAAFPITVLILKIAGATYPLYMACDIWKYSNQQIQSEVKATTINFFRKGFLVNITNPKIAIFFASFLPQFLGHTRSQPTLQLLMLGLLLQLCGLIVDLLVGLAAGVTREKILGSPKSKRRLDRLAGGTYAILGSVLLIEAVKEIFH